MIGRLRLWSGYVLFLYVVTHLLNHALGLVSLRALEEGRHWFAFVWSNPAGLSVLDRSRAELIRNDRQDSGTAAQIEYGVVLRDNSVDNLRTHRSRLMSSRAKG